MSILGFNNKLLNFNGVILNYTNDYIPLPSLLSIDLLVVAGGGGGGYGLFGGGGGAGGVQYLIGQTITVGTYSVIVGLGGTGGFTNGTSGNNSSFNGIISIGGGNGGGNSPVSNGGSGGGGNGITSEPGGTGIVGQGNSGATGNGTNGGGGGGAGTSPTNQNGGNGLLCSINGISTYYGGGGGGYNSLFPPQGLGGLGGGGDVDTDAIANTGGGGGGAKVIAGAGGSGIVIISYPTGSLTASGGTVSYVSGNTIHTFTSNSDFIINDNSIDPDLVIWLSLLSVQPSAGWITNTSDYIKNLKGAGIWNKLDRLWVFATEQQEHARISIKNPYSTNISEIASPTWIANQGYNGNGSSSYLDTNYIASVDGVNYVTADASLGIYSRSNVSDNTWDMGAYTAAGNFAGLVITGFGAFYGPINEDGGFNGPANASSLGLFSADRNGTQTNTYKNGSLQWNRTSTAKPVPSVEFLIGALNQPSDIATAFSVRQYALSWIGGSIDHTVMYPIVQAYATSQGFQV